MKKSDLKITLTIFFFLALVGISFAQEGYNLIVPIPTGSGVVSEVVNPAQYLRTVYNFGLAIAGILAILRIVYAAIKRIVSVGNSSQIADANDIITNALTGLVLLFAAYIILRTIDPKLVELSLPTLQQIQLPKKTSSELDAELLAFKEKLAQTNKAVSQTDGLVKAAEQELAAAKASGDTERILTAEINVAEAEVVRLQAAVAYNRAVIDDLLIRVRDYDQLVAQGKLDPSAYTKEAITAEYEKAIASQMQTAKTLEAAKSNLETAKNNLYEYQIETSNSGGGSTPQTIQPTF